MTLLKNVLVTAGCALLTAACATVEPDGPGATAIVRPASGSQVHGEARFTQVGNRVRVTAEIAGLSPGAHGFHIHEKGDCSAADGMSTGGHFNPGGHSHGSQGMEHHAGDMPSLKADGYGNANASFELKGVAVGSGPADLVGRGLIVHRDPDDLKTQPTGNAGPRIACAVIRKS